MGNLQNIELMRGRTGTITVTVPGVEDWTGIQGLLVVADKLTGEVVLSKEPDNIDTVGSILSFIYTHAETSAMTAKSYSFEIIIYKADKSLVQTPAYGELSIIETVRVDPTV